MPYDLIVKGGTVVSASDTFIADLGVVNGKVVSVGKITERPTRDAIPVAAQEQLIVELYSK